MTQKIAGQIVFTECNKIFTQNDNLNDCYDYFLKLSENIKKYGILNPILIRPVKYGMYEIISGKKRFKAAKLSGFTSVPCIIIDTDEKTGACINFIENYFHGSQDVFKKSKEIKKLILDYKYTIDEVSDILGEDIFEVINRLKILNFTQENKIKIKNSGLSYNQCLMLTKLDDTENFDKILDEIISEHLNDFQTEELINKILKNKKSKVTFKDIKLFTNTIENAIDKMKNFGINVVSDKTENEEKIEYSIIIDVKSQNM